MAFSNPASDEVRRLLTEARTIAVVGASNKPYKPSHRIFSYLRSAGYRVYPVNPQESEVQGEPSYERVQDIPEKVDIVDVFRRAEHTPQVAADAVEAGAGALWLQLGIENEEAAATASAAGLTVVMDMCIAVEHGELGIPPKS
ncbi:MAG TPA: CoA-binding protein [Actinomycetota bacterium]|nr:CoA-binding protein [Actinomycetota bacterium]